MTNKLICLMSLVAVLVVSTAPVAIAADPDLVGWWTFDETSGTTAADASGNGNDGTCQGDVSWVTGVMGNAWHGDGSGDYVQIPHTDSLNISDTVTVTVWVYQTREWNHQIISKAASDNGWGWNQSYGIQLAHANEANNNNVPAPYCVQFSGNPAKGNGVAGSTTVPLSEWVHIAATFDVDAAGNNAKVYFNGVLNGEGRIEEPLETNTADVLIGADSYGATRNHWQGMLDDVRIYSRALTEVEVQRVMRGMGAGLAGAPSPSDTASDVPTDVVLEWTAGEFAETHDVYLGTTFADVNEASRSDQRGVLVSQGHNISTYAPDRLQFGQTYYWRVDEVNAPPDSTIFKGGVWSFSTEPMGYPLVNENIAVTASSANKDTEGPENVINGSGLDANDVHSVVVTDMWRTSAADADPWIQFSFDRPYLLHEMNVWNYNSALEPDIGFGIKEAMVEYSLDGNEWATLDTVEFAQANGQEDNGVNETIAFNGAVAQYVRIAPVSNWGGILTQYGLSEVRFLYVPVRAREPEPEPGAGNMDPELMLKWRAGRQAATHQVYLSSDEAAVADGVAPVTQVSEPLYQTDPLLLGQTYYWRVDEVNEVEDPSIWGGNIWNFTIRDVVIVEDFEAYTDDMEAGEAIFQTWIDGLENGTGSFVGYEESNSGTFGEVAIVHGGLQAMPLFYDNTGATVESVATRTFAQARDWTQSGMRGLVLYVQGRAENTGGQLYVQINDMKVPYDGDPENLMRSSWNKWYVELDTLDAADLQEVTSLSVGVDGGGQGVVYVDDIQLTAEPRRLITPVDPGTANLAGHWEFDEGAGTTAVDSSGNGHDGTITGTQWAAGQIGGALSFDGVGDFVTVPPEAWSSIEDEVTVAFWAYGDPDLQPRNDVIFRASQDLAGGVVTVANIHLPFGNGNVYWDAGGNRISKNAAPSQYEGAWQHWVFTKNANTGEMRIYLNGGLWHSGTGMTGPMAGVAVFAIGANTLPPPELSYAGDIDDFRLYDRALSREEATWLAGHRIPFDE